MRFGSDRQGRAGIQTLEDPALPTPDRPAEVDPRWEPEIVGRQSVSQGPPGDLDRLLRILGIRKAVLAEARKRAARNLTSLEQELIASGAVDAADFYGAVAAMLEVPFIDAVAPSTVVVSEHIDSALVRPERLSAEIGGRLRHVVAPRADQVGQLARFIADKPALRGRFAVTTPAAIREAVWSCRSGPRARETVRALFERNMADSARLVMTGAQGFCFGLLLALLAMTGNAAPAGALVLLHLVLSVFFFGCIALRMVALLAYRKPVPRVLPRGADQPTARYSVLVALYDEAAMVPQLVASLSRLEWPRSLIEIKLVCEADDAPTVQALEAMRLPPEFEIVRVPAIGPRTKPKALHYALSGVSGDYLVIYDAEDRPHPEQLLEAYATFRQSDPRVAYLQAPLVISNARGSKWSAVFALEYAGLFRGLLPFLAKQRLPMPLGGTSNHFRLDVLKASGAWDPYNVTEDADLGLRLFRQGYLGGVLNKATQETAPVAFVPWMRQRTRWLKGWLQTWLVLMRAPLRLTREMGLRAFLVFQVLIAGMLLSALGHPLLIGFVGWGILAVMRGNLSPGISLELGALRHRCRQFLRVLSRIHPACAEGDDPGRAQAGGASLGLRPDLLAGDVVLRLARADRTHEEAVLLGKDAPRTAADVRRRFDYGAG